jgi:hypothetical protein
LTNISNLINLVNNNLKILGIAELVEVKRKSPASGGGLCVSNVFARNKFRYSQNLWSVNLSARGGSRQKAGSLPFSYWKPEGFRQIKTAQLLQWVRYSCLTEQTRMSLSTSGLQERLKMN